MVAGMAAQSLPSMEQTSWNAALMRTRQGGGSATDYSFRHARSNLCRLRSAPKALGVAANFPAAGANMCRRSGSNGNASQGGCNCGFGAYLRRGYLTAEPCWTRWLPRDHGNQHSGAQE